MCSGSERDGASRKYPAIAGLFNDCTFRKYFDKTCLFWYQVCWKYFILSSFDKNQSPLCGKVQDTHSCIEETTHLYSGNINKLQFKIHIWNLDFAYISLSMLTSASLKFSCDRVSTILGNPGYIHHAYSFNSVHVSEETTVGTEWWCLRWF